MNPLRKTLSTCLLALAGWTVLTGSSTDVFHWDLPAWCHALWCPQTSPRCDVDALQQLADDCLYAAKRQGRNRLVVRQLDLS